MATPKRKTSKARRNKRRAHDSLKTVPLTECPNCGARQRMHQVCQECGYYRGRQVMNVS